MFERLMARRYITEQKRHSVLTICSIAAALSLMTLLFTCLSTGLKIARDVSFDMQPSHLEIVGLTDEQAEIVTEFVGETGNITIIEEKGENTAHIMFTEYIGENISVYAGNLSEKLGPVREININSQLVFSDMIDLSSRADFAILFSMFFVVVLFFALMLRLVIDTAFEISSKERERQFGVLQSVGATPSQIVKIITMEGLMLSAAGIPAGLILGTWFGYCIFRAVLSSGIAKLYLTPEKISELIHFHVDPLYLAMAAVTGLIWVLLSAYGTGMRVVKMSPIQAISNRSNTVKKVKRHSLFGMIFGWKGKMAARNNYRQPKRFIITVLSLTLSITLFSAMKVITDIFEESLTEISMVEYFQSDIDLKYEGYSEGSTPYREVMSQLKNSGYFSRVATDIWRVGRTTGDDEYYVDLMYYAPDEYAELFDGKPPVSYDELTESGGYCLLVPEKEYAFAGHVGEVSVGDALTLDVMKNFVIFPDEYESLRAEEKQGLMPTLDNDGNPIYYLKLDEYTCDFKVTASGTAEKPYADFYKSYGMHEDEGEPTQYVLMVGTLDIYDSVSEDIFGTYRSIGFNCNVAEDCYISAVDFIGNIPELKIDFDNFEIRRQINTVITAVKIFTVSDIVLFSLIALVNMVNILSTSVLNRRSKLASMQCIGMTDGQLYGMTAVECLQYSLTAAVLSVIACTLLIYGTEQLMGYMQVTEYSHLVPDYFAPIPKIILASAVSFFVAICSSFIPLMYMQKNPLVEMIRQVD